MRKKYQLKHKGKTIRVLLDLSLVLLKARKAWANIFQILKLTVSYSQGSSKRKKLL